MKREFNRRNCRKRGQKRLNSRIYGGNWQGTEYLSYREHDMLVRLTRLPGDEQADRATALRIIKAARPQS
jgi:hypothetical protein